MKYGDGGVDGFWGAISYYGLSPIIEISGKINSND